MAAAFIAGTVDAIAGGGGLITVPALLAVGLDPHIALGTNKGQSVFGSSAALFRFWRAGRVDTKLARLTFPLGFIGSLLGATLVLNVPAAVLKIVVIALLLGTALFVFLRNPSKTHPLLASTPEWAAPLMALLIGGYDGFFGPGTGTFLIVGFVALLGRTLTHASADAKVVNFASNLAAVIIFGLRGVILWKVSLPMAAAQFLGGNVGAHLTLKGGDKLVRRVVLVVVFGLVAKLLRDLYVG